MSKAEFVENFVSKVSELERFKETPEEVLKADAEAMYETKPIFLEDLGIDHITIDEVHNYKNIFTSAKLKKDKK
jgi:N12 class adenine-specific DNA methylase